MDALELLEWDHDRVREMLSELASSGAADWADRLAELRYKVTMKQH